MPAPRGYQPDERWLIAALQGRITLPVPAAALAVAEAHRVDGLVGAALVQDDRVPSDTRAVWRDRLHALVAADLVRHGELSVLCADIKQAGLRPLLLKGAGLAYTDYRAPWQRPQDDVDLWCRGDEVAPIRMLLERRGYAPSAVSRPDETGQIHFIRRDAADVHHQVELHLRMLTPTVFADALTFDEALRAARPIDALAGALTLGSTHALFLACLHRVGHHFQSPRLIWLYDIDLIGRSLRPDDWNDLRTLAERTGMRAVVRANIDDASRALGLQVPAEVLTALQVEAEEPSRAFLTDGLREIDVQWSNLQHAPSWRARGALIHRRLLPPADYMRARYGIESALWLPALYVWRLISQAPAWFARHGDARGD